MKRTEGSIPEDFNYELLISSQHGTLTEWKLVAEDEAAIPVAWVYLKFGTELPEVDEREAINLVQMLATICAEQDIGVIIGSWRGLYVDFVEEFYSSRNDKDSTEFVKVLAESDHHIFKNNISENFSIEAINIDFTAELKSYASACIMVGDTNSTDEITSIFLTNNKAVFPFYNDKVYKSHIKLLDEREYKEIYVKSIGKDEFIGPQEHLLNGFERFLKILVNSKEEI